jgi:uncharacterized protein (TIGR00369 family)
MFMVIAIHGTSLPGQCQITVQCKCWSYGANAKHVTGSGQDRREHFCGSQPVRKHGRMTKPSGPSAASGRDVIAAFLPQSPFVAKLGIVADQLSDDEVRLRLPWDPSNVTIGDMVHGGAIATLADLTVMAAAWCGVDAPPELRGVTVSMTLDFMAPARATDVIGVGRVLRRGRSLTNCEAEIVDPRGNLVAKALATYKVG